MRLVGKKTLSYMDPMGYMLMLQKNAETAVASSWWFQPRCKILVKIKTSPNRGENEI